MSNKAGWYRDPYGDELRWWDGARWTDWVVDDPAVPHAPPIPASPQAPSSVPDTPTAAALPGSSPDASDSILHRAQTPGLFAGVEAGVGAPASSRPSTSSRPSPPVARPAVVPPASQADFESVAPPTEWRTPDPAPPSAPPPQPPGPTASVGTERGYQPLRARRGSTPGRPIGSTLRNLGRWFGVAAFIVFAVGSCLFRGTTGDSQSEIVVDPDFPPSDPAWDLEVQRACELGRATPSLPSNDLIVWNPAWADEGLWRIELVTQVDSCIGSVAAPTSDGVECGPVEPAALLLGPRRYAGACVTMTVEVTQRGSADMCLFAGVWDNPVRGLTPETQGPESWFRIADTQGFCEAVLPLTNPGQRLVVAAIVDGANEFGEHRGATVPLPLFEVHSATPQP